MKDTDALVNETESDVEMEKEGKVHLNKRNSCVSASESLVARLMKHLLTLPVVYFVPPSSVFLSLCSLLFYFLLSCPSFAFPFYVSRFPCVLSSCTRNTVPPTKTFWLSDRKHPCLSITTLIIIMCNSYTRQME